MDAIQSQASTMTAIDGVTSRLIAPAADPTISNPAHEGEIAVHAVPGRFGLAVGDRCNITLLAGNGHRPRPQGAYPILRESFAGKFRGTRRFDWE